MSMLKGSPWLKLAAVVSAVLTYWYVHNEMYNIKMTSPDPSYKLFKLTAKTLSVKARIATEAPEGYEILTDQVVVNPDHVTVIGPEAMLDEASSAETAPVDVGGATQDFTKRIPIESVAGTPLTGQPQFVEVTIPIRKVKPENNPK